MKIVLTARLRRVKLDYVEASVKYLCLVRILNFV